MSDRGPRRRFQLPLLRHRVPELIDREFRFHIEERIEGLVASGMSRPDAEAEVLRRFGSYAAYRDATRTIDEDAVGRRHRVDLGAAIGRGVTTAVRTLGRARSFSATVILTLALGMGATTAIFSALDAIVLRPLPYPDAESLVAVKHTVNVPGNGEGHWGLSAAGYFHLRNEAQSFTAFGAFSTTDATLVERDEATRVHVATTTASLYNTLGLRTVLGRPITDADDQPGAERVVVVSHEAWQSRFGGDSSIVGRRIALGGSPLTVVGVMAPGTVLPAVDLGRGGNLGHAFERVEFWAALRLDPAANAVNAHWYAAIGRLKPGVTRVAAAADLQRQVMRFGELFPSAYSAAFLEDYAFGVTATPLRDDLLGSTGRVLWLLLGSVVVVFLIAAGNAANLLAARAEVRRREVAIRTALGASRVHVTVEQVAEVLVLCSIAALVGLGAAALGLRSLVAAAPEGLPRMDEVTLSWRSWFAAAGLALGSGLLLGIIPRVRASHRVDALRDGSRGGAVSPARRRARGALVVMQVTLAVVLLVASGVLIRSVMRLQDVEPGFDPRGVLAVDLPLPGATYRNYEDVARFHRSLAERVGAIPGVQHVGMGTDLPLEGMNGCAVIIAEGVVRDPQVEPPCVTSLISGPGYFDALGIKVQGRIPGWHDLDEKSGAVVVSRALADRLWPGKDPIGRGVRGNGDEPPFYRVSGVIESLRGTGLEHSPTEVVFYPLQPIPGADLWGPPRNASMVIRTAQADPGQLTGAIRREVAAIDPRVPLVNIRTVDDVVRRSLARIRFIMILLGTAAALALLLSAVGLFSVISYLVTQRRPEIGVRLALGARMGQVSSLILRESLAWTATGICMGLAIGLVVNRLLGTLLFEVSPTDPVTLLVVSVVLLGVATAASVLPARRASRVNPADVLREG